MEKSYTFIKRFVFNLMDEHPHGDTGHVESVQKILDGHLSLVVHVVSIFQLQDPLGHGLHHAGVPGLDCLQSLTESGKNFFISQCTRLELDQVSETACMPILDILQ